MQPESEIWIGRRILAVAAVLATAVIVMIAAAPIGPWHDGTDLDATDPLTGDCGDKLTYTLDLDTGKLTISGTGNMTEFSRTNTPWYSHMDSIKSVVLQEGVTSIGSYAFYNCKTLTSADIPDSVTSIGSYAFFNCVSLTSVDIPDSVTSIGTYGFSQCTGLTSVDIPKGLTSIGEMVFYWCTGLTSVDIPDWVTSIGMGAFCNCTALTSVRIGDGVTSIGSMAFYYDISIEEIAFGSKLTTMEDDAFNFKFYDRDGGKLTDASALRDSTFRIDDSWRMVKAQEYTVTFDPDRGNWSGSTSSDKLVKYYDSGQEIEPASIELPERIGYGSVGWFCNGKTYIAGDKVVVTSDMTFIPNWHENCAESCTTFDPNGGEWADGTSQILEVEFEEASCRVTFVGTSQIQITILGLSQTEQRSVENPTKSGFEFIGWCSGEGIMYPAGMVTDYCWDRSFKAVWKEKAEEFTVTFDPNGGNWSGSTEPQEYPIASGNAIELADVAPPTRDSCTFGGWSFNGKTYSAGEKVTVQSNMTFKAEWTESGKSEPDVPVDPVAPAVPIAPFITVDGQETIEAPIGEDEDAGNKTDTRTILLIAVVAAIIAELAVLIVSKRL